MGKFKLNTLPQELVSQIAAGEVIERPASVVKELVDNSIDAGADRITVRIVNGGMELIEVSDNGTGIPYESLADIFNSHTTTKISSIEDLNTLLTMGFRGEALSAIVSVAHVHLISKHIDSAVAGEILYKGYDEYSTKKAAREVGTVVSIKNIFENIPARKKFLKSAATEYKRILDILYPYFLIYPNISFTVVKDGKDVIDLKSIPNSRSDSIEKERIGEVLKGDFVSRMLKVFYNGAGMKITGLVGHPSDHQRGRVNQYMFVNSRPVWDSGIAKAVIQGYDRYIPFGERVPFILLVDITPELVDVNVHPRKEEIRFLNPFRAYSGIEEAVRKAVSSATSYKVKSSIEYGMGAGKDISLVNRDMDRKVYSQRDIRFKPVHSSSVRDSLLFSKEVLAENMYTKSAQTDVLESGGIRNIFQVFNKYIVIEFESNSLWFVDQHAAAERITFEKLKNFEKENVNIQSLLVSVSLRYSDKEIVVLKDIKKFLTTIGIAYTVKKNSVEVNQVPVEFVGADFKKLFEDILSIDNEEEDISKGILNKKDDILATISCHTSVRSGQKLLREEMIDIYKRLIVCENPYSCPHGRPAVWKLNLRDIDSNFERTY